MKAYEKLYQNSHIPMLSTSRKSQTVKARPRLSLLLLPSRNLRYNKINVMVNKSQKHELHFIAKASGLTKLAICVGLASAAAPILSVFKIDIISTILISWDVLASP